MALLAEEIVEEWLNRQGYFTIRGIKLGVHEIDLLAVNVSGSEIECRHFEVQASVRPVSYLSKVPKAVQIATGRAPGSAKERTESELEIGVKEWVERKYLLERKDRLRRLVYPGHWTFELVVHELRHPEEVKHFEANGVRVHHLRDIIRELSSSDLLIESAAGASLVDLVLLD